MHFPLLSIYCFEKNMTNWTRRPQEQSGSYQFNGAWYISSAILETIPLIEIIDIIVHLRETAAAHHGLDKIQIYDNYAGLTVYIFDQLCGIEKIMSPPEHNFATMFFDWEY